MKNSTMEKFGYPDTLIGEMESWAVMLRPAQVTLGSLILACREDATSLGAVSPEASQEFAVICKRVESLLATQFAPDKLNFMALMMIDPHVHFHIVPRYETARQFLGKTLVDRDWPKPPNLLETAEFSEDELSHLLEELRRCWRESLEC